MDLTLISLHGAVLVAALLQAATGIGFGVIAGPVILMALDSGDAIQVSALLSLLIAVVLAPGLRRQIDKVILSHLIIGTVFGLPIGIVVFLFASVDILKLLAGLAVLFLALSASGVLSIGIRRGQSREGRVRNLSIGALSGAMSSSLAMPGPVVAGHLSALAVPKEQIRATILVMFVFSFGAAVAVQAMAVGIAGETLRLTATLVPATAIGIVLGHVLVSQISEAFFHRVIIIVLAITAFSLLTNAAVGLL